MSPTACEKRPFLTLDKAREIAARYPTPFHIYDEAGIRRTARALNAAFSWNPGFKEYFAVKATPNPAILRILGEEGCGVDCSSMTELTLAKACGFSGEEIMFSSNNTPDEEFARARELGAFINLDDYTLIDALERACGVPETVFCRYNPGGEFAIGNEIMDQPREAKYGMTRAQLFDAYRALAAKGAKRFGLHAFLASNTLTDAYYPVLARILFETAAELYRETGVRLSYVNLSGGVGIPYRPGERENDIAAIGAAVREAYGEVLVPAGLGDVAIFAELGRYMLGPHGALVTAATHEKHIYKEYIGVDACACDLIRPAMYGAYHHVSVLGKEDAPCDRVYDIVGSLCENNDKFAIDRRLPKIDMGDLLFIHDTGAHGHSMGYNYNGKLRSAEILLHEDGRAELIRRAETPRDYFATLDVSGLPLGGEGKVVLVLGKLGAGKTEYARRLCAGGRAVMPSVDGALISLFGQDAGERHDDYADRIRAYMRGKTLEMLAAGVDVVLDWGLWTRKARAELREFYVSRGIRCETHALRVDDATWRARIERRNRDVEAGRETAYYVDDGLMQKFLSRYEEPGEDEVDVWVEG